MVDLRWLTLVEVVDLRWLTLRWLTLRWLTLRWLRWKVHTDKMLVLYYPQDSFSSPMLP